MVDPIALPVGLQPLAGRLVDVDSHEMMAAQTWVDFFGPEVKELADAVIAHSLPWETDNNSHNAPNYAGDVMAITDQLMSVKGPMAPGANDLTRRLDVMGAMGVQKQLMYPTGLGGWSMFLMMVDKYDPGCLSSVRTDRGAKAAKWLKRYNEWFLTTTKLSERIRPVPTLIGATVEELMAETHRMLDAGVRAVMLPASMAPGGRSPAHPDLEPFWALLEEVRCVPTLHLGSEGKMLESLRVWRDAPVFDGYRAVGEFNSDPWYTSMVHFPAQNFLQTMCLGGVFVRHPELRVGAIELGAYWVGPMMRNLDMWYVNLGAFGAPAKRLPELPSSYLKRNVRYSVFPWEDLASYIDQFGLEDVICFASDYPHLEGGRDMITQMYEKIAPYGAEMLEKFFVTNGDFLFPN
jgi:predicted TIM-barrel fold metal-dependent hydrolase